MTMKQTTALILTLVLAVAVMVAPAAAAEAGKEDTTATVTFEGEVGPGGAKLYLKDVPTFDFGNHTISASDKAYAMTTTIGKLLCVVDGRGTGTGWNVTAQIKDPFTSQTTSTPLTGSRILISGATVSYGATALTPPPAPTQPGSVTLNNSGEPAVVFKAEEGQGKGIWNDNLDAVSLEVPGGSALAEAYTATVVWTLNDVPA